MDLDADAAFAREAIEHPDACSTDEDYPGWTPRYMQLTLW